MHISIRLIRLQGILVTIIIGLVAATDTSRFKSVKDREYIGVISTY